MLQIIFIAVALFVSPQVLLAGPKIPKVIVEKGEPGLPGLKGEDGLPGEKGDKGDRGEKGDKGDKGEKGDPGESGIKGQSAAYGYLFKTSDEEVLPNKTIVFENVGVIGEGLIYDPLKGLLTILEDGDYSITYYVNPLCTSELTFGISLNGIRIIPGSVYKVSSMKFVPIIAENIAPQVSGQMIVGLTAGSSIALVNLSHEKVAFNGQEKSVNASLYLQKIR